MKNIIIGLLAILISPLAGAAVETGQTAPNFTVANSEGKTVKLSDYHGKTVVLEWLNYGCPFVQKHYQSKNMQNLQKKYTGQGVVWLSVISSAPGKQGHVTAAEAQGDRKKMGSAATAILLDETGAVGKLYGAQTTPHMFVIDRAGKVVYQGAIDDTASTDVADVKTAKNYVSQALDAISRGKTVEMAQTKAYGCGVKYN